MITLLKGDSYTARGLEVEIALPGEGMSRLDGIELHLPMGIHKAWYLPKDGETLKTTFSASEIGLLPEGVFNARLLAIKDAEPYLISRLPIKITSDPAEANLTVNAAGTITGVDGINLDLTGINEEPRTDRELATAFGELLKRLKAATAAMLIAVLACTAAHADSLVSIETATSGDIDLDGKVVTGVTLSDKVATKDDITEATTAIFDAYGTTDTHIEVKGSELAIKVVPTEAETNLVWSIDAAITNASEQIASLDTRVTNVENRADLTSWGDFAPDGTPNPDPLAMLYLNKPSTVFGSGFSWATSGSYAVLCQSGAVAFAGEAGGEVRFGLDIYTNYLAWVRPSSIEVGARAETFAVAEGIATIEYAYSGGDYPTVWYCTDLTKMEWQEAANGSWEYVPGAAYATFRYSVEGLDRCFFRATTSRAMGAHIRAPIPIKPEGGLMVGESTIVPDSIITIEVNGKQYRILAQEVTE